ncbi:MATE family efflux transporter [Clostridium sp. 19966]|uniref:MATE family efflux transporter n=1 Tax=Clostridium sp. 19966 TaxID=2768166 RepID=UPI0028DE93ED|nr:MATE family efflux transporter [Clostridium sp. 19966]MDT8717908.1 MATE family efflux transporter [Clostridium sp. 19966]
MQAVHTKAEIDREILKLAWPTIAEQMLIMTVGMVSTIMVSRLGKESVAAVGMVNNLVNFFQTVFAGLATGSTIVIARVTGESGLKRAKKVLTQSLFMAIIVGIGFLMLGYAGENIIINVFFGSAASNVLSLVHMYYKIVLVGIPFVILDMVVGGALRGVGDTKTPMYVTFVVNIVNIVFSIILIYGLHLGGIVVPALGVKGAAIASSFARFCGGIMILFVLFRKKSKIHLDKGDKLILNGEIMMRIIRVGIPSFMENLIMQGGFLVIQILIVSLGTAEVAAYQVGTNIHSLAFLPIMGFATTTTTTVGQSLGRKDYDGAESYAYENRKIAVLVGLMAGLLEFTFARNLAMLYTNDPEVISASIIIIRGFSIIEPFMGIEKVSAAVMRCAGDIKYVIITAVIALWTFRVCTASTLNHFFHIGLYGIIIGIIADFSVRAIMYLFRMKAGKWKYLKV